MKKFITLVLALVCVFALVGCGKATGNGEPVAGGADMPNTENNMSIETEQTQQAVSDAEKYVLIPMVMINDELYLATGHEASSERKCGTMDGEITSAVDSTEQPTENNQSNFGTGYGYQYGSHEGLIEVYMNDKWWVFATEKALASSQMITEPEFVIIDENWGITLTAENITPTGAIIKCTQSSGEPTGELQTGSWYIVENWTQENGWKELPYIIDGEISWTQEAWMIPMNDTCEWEVNWEWLYGELPAGKYRIGKEIMDFRASGDHDKDIYFIEFEIE